MSSSALSRLAVTCLVVLPAAAIPARAGEFLHNLFHGSKGCCAETQRITLPAQQVEVVAEQPRVVVREMGVRSIHRTAAVGAVPVGTVYMPMAFQVPAVSMMGAFNSAPVHEVTESANPLEVAHRAEVMALRSEQARAELQATVAAHQRVLQRIAAGPAPSPNGSDISSSVEQRLNQLSSDLTQLTNRVSSVERLLIIHDNVLKTKVGGSSGTGSPSVPTPSSDSSTGPETPKVSATSSGTTPPPMQPDTSSGSKSKPGTPPVMIPPNR
jgi:hypothetical protein